MTWLLLVLTERAAPRQTGGKLHTECLATAILTLSCMLKEMTTRLHSVQDLLCSCLLSKYVNVKIYRTVILPTVVYGCETWSPTLKEEQRLMVFENRVLRETVVGKSGEMTADWRKLHSEELCDLYC